MKNKLPKINDSPIGIFDSGLGGLTVLHKLKKILPNEQYIYFGDTAHLPYGSKSNENIIEYSKNIVQFLLSKKVKAIIIACNSASSVAIETIENICDIPVFEVITPSILEAINQTKTNHIGIIGTHATINSKIYKNKIKQLNSKITTTQIASPLLVPIIEEGLENTTIAHAVVKLYLKPMLQSKIDTIILGCTHYPIISNLITTIISDKIKLISSGKPVAQSLLTYFQKNKCFNIDAKPQTYFYVSDSPKKFKKLGSKFLNDEILNIEICEL